MQIKDDPKFLQKVVDHTSIFESDEFDPKSSAQNQWTSVSSGWRFLSIQFLIKQPNRLPEKETVDNKLTPNFEKELK